MTIYNAEITSTFLGVEDHGIMTFLLHLEWPGYGIGYGGYALDSHAKPHRIANSGGKGYQAIRCLLETLQVPKWEALTGKLCRVDFDESPGGTINRIGHIVHDRWFDLRGWMAEP